MNAISPDTAAPVVRRHALTPTGRIKRECIRIFVPKQRTDRAKTCAPHRREFTCIYVRRPVYDELLAIANGDAVAVSEACRTAAIRGVKKDGVTWTATVLAGARRLLTVERGKLEALQRAAAAANNAAWKQR